MHSMKAAAAVSALLVLAAAPCAGAQNIDSASVPINEQTQIF
jgi:hypothetical protein